MKQDSIGTVFIFVTETCIVLPCFTFMRVCVCVIVILLYINQIPFMYLRLRNCLDFWIHSGSCSGSNRIFKVLMSPLHTFIKQTFI